MSKMLKKKFLGIKRLTITKFLFYEYTYKNKYNQILSIKITILGN